MTSVFGLFLTSTTTSRKNGVEESTIWISILGEVYDVTKGEDHYAPKKSYSAFAGRDASVPFCTGKFTAEEASKSPDVLQNSDLYGLADWRDFYRSHGVYRFVGRLIDPRYYSESGEPTEPLVQLEGRIEVARVEYLEKAKQRQIEREKRKKEGKTKVTKKESVTKAARKKI
jgi:Cytochrome b5-like Heme/Steroid binding domain